MIVDFIFILINYTFYSTVKILNNFLLKKLKLNLKQRPNAYIGCQKTDFSLVLLYDLLAYHQSQPYSMDISRLCAIDKSK